MRDRRGFTLIELIVVTVLGSLVVMSALTVLITNQRTYTAQSATISGQQSTRMALEVLFNELRETSPAGGDILAMSSSSIRLRLMRKFSVVCDTDFGGQPDLIVINAIMGPSYRFEIGDSVFVFADNDENDDADDVWIAARIGAVDTTFSCPHDAGVNASELTFNGQNALFSADLVQLGAPVRSYVEFTFGLTMFRGDPYLGRQEGTGDMIPVAGPLRATTGLEFVYRDAQGAVTAVRTDVRQIEVKIRTGSGVLNSLGREVSDSITAWIYTRN